MSTTEEARRQYQNLAEEAIDKYGLQQTLQMIAEICWEKAEHIRSTWQDTAPAKWQRWQSSVNVWDKASQMVSRLAATRTVEVLSK